MEVNNTKYRCKCCKEVFDKSQLELKSNNAYNDTFGAVCPRCGRDSFERKHEIEDKEFLEWLSDKWNTSTEDKLQIVGSIVLGIVFIPLLIMLLLTIIKYGCLFIYYIYKLFIWLLF